MAQVGEVTFYVQLNGRRVPLDAQRLGTTAGLIFRSAFNRAAGSSTGGQADVLRTLTTQTQQLSSSLREYSNSSDGAERSTRRLGSAWSRIPYNGRQFILILSAIVSGAEQISVLGAAAASGIFVIAGALAALVSGGIIAGVAIGGLVSRYEDMLKAGNPLAVSLKRLGERFGELRDAISDRVFVDFAERFDRLATVIIPGLEGAILSLADYVGSALRGAFDQLSTDRALDTFYTLILRAGPVFERLVQAAVNFVEALANVGVIAGPQIQNFADRLEELGDRFLRFTETDTAGIERFFRNGERVLGAFVSLLGTTVTMLGRLATDRAFQRTETFLQDLQGSMAFFESLFRSLGELNLFGIIAQVLNDLGNALIPVLDLLRPIFNIINIIATQAISGLAFAISLLTPLLIPLEVGFGLLAFAIEKVVEWIKPYQDALAEVFGAQGGVAESILAGILPAFDDLIDAFLELFPEPKEFARILKEEVIPRIQDFAKWMEEDGVKAINLMIRTVEAAIKIFDVFSFALDLFLVPFKAWVGTMLIVLQPLITAFNILAGAIRTVLGLGGGTVPQPVYGRGGGGFAAGGIVSGAAYRLTGEEGPEMIVPLSRPLNQVDPAVRAISAYAQGIPYSGGSTERAGVIINQQNYLPDVDPFIAASIIADRTAVAVKG